MDAQQVTADLESGDPDRVATALAELDLAWRQRRFAPVPAPEVRHLDAFRGAVPQDTLIHFINALQHYPIFAPHPDLTEIRRRLVEAVLRHGPGQPAFEVALFVRADDFPDSAVRDVMRYLDDRDLNNATEEAAASQLVEHLLESVSTRGATVDGLAGWALFDRFPGLVDRLLPQLETDERERIAAARA
jgi:hypothetical protein